MWIDSHCHLDAAEFGTPAEADTLARQAEQVGVKLIVIPAVACANFATVADMAARLPNCVYALGIHPMYVEQATEVDLQTLRAQVLHAMSDKKFVAIGEIGLDFFVPGMALGPLREKQEYFFSEQLKLARECALPVLLHVRRSQDTILKYLRRIRVLGGIAHAFNGSAQQADLFVSLNFKLGFGGALTFSRALQIRRLACTLPLDALVLETDAPDIPPAWLAGQANSPLELPAIGAVLAELRGLSLQQMAQASSANVLAALPRLQPTQPLQPTQAME